MLYILMDVKIIGLQLGIDVIKTIQVEIQVYGSLNHTRDILWVNSVRGDEGSMSLTRIPMQAFVASQDECSLELGA